MVFTAHYAVRHLGVDIIEELAEQMAPEEGHLSGIARLDETAKSIAAFTCQGSTTWLPGGTSERSAFRHQKIPDVAAVFIDGYEGRGQSQAIRRAGARIPRASLSYQRPCECKEAASLLHCSSTLLCLDFPTYQATRLQLLK